MCVGGGGARGGGGGGGGVEGGGGREGRGGGDGSPYKRAGEGRRRIRQRIHAGRGERVGARRLRWTAALDGACRVSLSVAETVYRSIPMVINQTTVFRIHTRGRMQLV